MFLVKGSDSTDPLPEAAINLSHGFSLQHAEELAAIGVVLHFNRMPRARNEVPRPECAFSFGLLTPIGWQLGFAAEELTDQPRLQLGQSPNAALRLYQADEEQTGMAGMKNAQIKRHMAGVLPVNEVRIKEGKTDGITGCGDDDIVPRRRAIDKPHRVIRNILDSGARVYFAVPYPIEDYRVDGRVRLRG